jgi:hypothetical protein
VHLRRHGIFLTREQLAEDASGEHLALTAVVDVCSVEERDAALDRAADDRLRLVLAERPRPFVVATEAHHPEADARDTQSRVSQVRVLHGETVVVGDE